MKIDVLSLFPAMFEGVFGESILKKAQEKNAVRLNVIDFREFSPHKQKSVDDYPYGGGAGMVLKPEPVFEAIDAITDSNKDKPRVILMCPQGERFTQKKAEELSNEPHLVFICGHYEGYDERIREHLVTDEISIGDFVLTGGELGAMVAIDSIVRLLPEVLGNAESAAKDSFSSGLLEHPHYTRPAVYRGLEVPGVLTSGNHANIEEWRMKESLRRTWERRPDLLEEIDLNSRQKEWLQHFEKDQKNVD
ncbi:tRNA (guanosine(37)-N1)-methyltransferase TrmD [Jeotgalibacillus campisalis]|uniref:tRNA (guanine-N(1)-)-methyltransferase n=1 Tax=Jeotgalibacillus campisalis TaxID=220754 RepID=A0A0C2S0W8_9BACL|nr:tRNA (guanosine(37)-N1)-methyltransferase TrmD [Jeotgalibacillus campisalis]KIL47694.1 tRNA (guanine-N1)-methyltransferase [Jeotgalibacillus campisalis]